MSQTKKTNLRLILGVISLIGILAMAGQIFASSETSSVQASSELMNDEEVRVQYEEALEPFIEAENFGSLLD